MLVEVVSIPITATTSQVERAVIQTLPTSAVICTNEPDFFVGWRRLRLRTADDLERLKVDSPLTVVIFRATPFFHRVSQLLSVSTTKPEAEQWMRKLPVGRQKAAIASIVMSALEGSCSGQDFWDQSGLLEAEKLPDCEFSRSLQRLSSIEARRRGSVPIRTRLARGQKVLDLILADPYEAFQIYFANHTAVLIDSVFPSIPLYGMERRLKCEFHSPPVVIEEGPIRLSTAQDCLCLLEIVQRVSILLIKHSMSHAKNRWLCS
ncbi:MAG: uncharacterized protein KVP18_000868 [Porospora cf. gigantea A]|uniref:uncharacterized protein n=1 Tax=Porospora cf. gigantea A TaxID=2853593 RepID=UPI00355A5903|nr:MAG: hypothetical protein KVP18_000868 [Porospora cf. gigantea A]